MGQAKKSNLLITYSLGLNTDDKLATIHTLNKQAAGVRFRQVAHETRIFPSWLHLRYPCGLSMPDKRPYCLRPDQLATAPLTKLRVSLLRPITSIPQYVSRKARNFGNIWSRWFQAVFQIS